MHAQAQPERPKGEGHGWPEFYSPQMRHQGRGDSGFSLSRLPAAQTPMPRPYPAARSAAHRARGHASSVSGGVGMINGGSGMA